MLKLLIIDDEEVICQTIAKIIDWSSLGIALIGTCCDGVEAYHTILDECPDIVMTDIRMPGISGLELIERIVKTDLNVHFIILSGYGEFDYAKRAMRCGVRHYLLKPCDEESIISCVREVIQDCRHDFFFSKDSSDKSGVYENLKHKIIQNILFEGCSQPDLPDSFLLPYEKYVNFYDSPYSLCFLYYLEEKNLSACLAKINEFMREYSPTLIIYRLYVPNILLLFYPTYHCDLERMNQFFKTLNFKNQPAAVQYETSDFSDLASLLNYLILKLKRFDVINFIDDNHIIPHYNYSIITTNCNRLLAQLLEENSQPDQKVFSNINDLLSSISNADFLIQLADNLIVTLAARLQNYPVSEAMEFLSGLRQETDPAKIRSSIYSKLCSVFSQSQTVPGSYSPFIRKTLQYMEDHFAEPDLTLKWIAENHLYMNVTYVSRCFVKETGRKFSTCLTDLRISKAKEILSSGDRDKIKNAATLVGCGNNPCYFSRLFKKCTGLTPTAYIRKFG